jgi:hypothetical protein
MTKAVQLVLATGMALSATGCALMGAPCLARQHSGLVTTISGEVAPGAVVFHTVRYGVEGSQNDLKITWPGQRDADGPRIRMFATRAGCLEFVPLRSKFLARDPCGGIGYVGSMFAPTARPCAVNGTCPIEPSDLVQTSVGIASGRGNPDIIGPTGEYRVWIVGDPTRRTPYVITITWFYGPDC